MLRFTDQLAFNQVQTNTATLASKAEAAQIEASTGIRVQHPGDDPAAAALIVSHQSALTRLTGTSTAMQRATDELNSADGSLASVVSLIQQAKQTATQMANGTNNASDRAAAAPQIQNTISQISAMMNARVGNRYVFGGDKDSTPPFDASGNYSGDTNVRQIEIAPGVNQAVSVRADVALKGTGGGVDVFATLSALNTALTNNDQSGITASIDQLNTALTQVTNVRSAGGTYVNALDTATTVNASAQTDEQAQISSLQDADPITSASQLTLSQTALQAAISSASQMFQFTLADKLR